MDAMGVRLDLHMNGDYLTPMAQTVRATASATIGGGVALVCGFKYLASEKSREPVGGDAAQALATCPDSAVEIKIGTTDMDNAIAIDNNHLTMNDTARTISGDHESRVTDTGTSIVQPAVCKTISAEGFDGMLDIQKGDGMPEEATHTLDRALEPTVAVGVDAYNQTLTGGVSMTNTEKNADPHHVPCVSLNHIVRRLTPVECERLQGFPSNFTEVDVFKMTKDEFIAWSLMMGNIECDIDTGCVYTTRGPGGVKCEPRRLNGTPLNGYLVVSIRDGAVKKQCRIHRIVWIAAHGIPEDGMVVDHINNDKTDNRIENLQLLTPAENSTKASKDGLYKVEEDAPMAKLTAEQHDEIRAIYETGVASLRSLARRYGISKSRVSQIIHEGSWTRIPYRGKPAEECPDSPRYKALGNSFATNCCEYVLRRIVAAFQLDMVPDNN